MAHYDIPLDLPHAGTMADRIMQLLERSERNDADYQALIEKVGTLFQVLAPYAASGENPADDEGIRVKDQAASIARGIVDDIEQLDAGFDRLGQYVRNLFECLELGEEGAQLSLRAGENPNSLLRPT
ncbi:MAG TPA: hypothetical protein VIL97_03580 [Thermoanaerobaculia bacterium]